MRGVFIFFGKRASKAGANPTNASCNASAVKIYISTTYIIA
jgi:hypothetical protein